MKKLVLIYLIFLFSQPLAAQDYYIEGFLFYPDNNKPVVNAEIYVHGTNLQTITDNFGGFKIRAELPGVYTLSYYMQEGNDVASGEETIDYSNDYAIIFYRPNRYACGFEINRLTGGCTIRSIQNFGNVETGSGKIIFKEWIEHTGIR
jgi:hypothetical protein